MTTIWEKVTENAKLISLPAVYIRLREVLDDPEYSVKEVADVISQDPAMTARILRLVNSAYFGLAAKIETVGRAINMLGAQQVHDLVLATSVAETFEGMSSEVMDMERYWRSSIYCAITSRELAVMCNVLDSERIFVAGLLRDIGHLIMYQTVPAETAEALWQAKKWSVPLYRMERAVLGIDYAKVGGVLMRQWNLPRSIWEPTEFHIEPVVEQEYVLFTVLVNLAHLITEAVLEDVELHTALDKVMPLVWQISGLEKHQCDGIVDRVDKQLASVMELIFPGRFSVTA